MERREKVRGENNSQIERERKQKKGENETENISRKKNMKIQSTLSLHLNLNTINISPAGVFEEEVVQEVMVGRTGHFHGCLKKIAFMSGVTSEEMVWHKGIRSSAYRSVKSRCRTK